MRRQQRIGHTAEKYGGAAEDSVLVEDVSLVRFFCDDCCFDGLAPTRTLPPTVTPPCHART